MSEASKAFQPELGHAVFGQPWQAYGVAEILAATFLRIVKEMDRVFWNLRQEEYDSPFNNTGASFRCSTFTVVSYSWSEDPQPYNFKHPETGLLVNWYKWCGRDASANMDVTPEIASRVLKSCLAAMLRIESGAETFDEPGQFPDGKLDAGEDDPQALRAE